MSESGTMVRTQVMVDDKAFFLAQGQDVGGLKERMESAVSTGPRFVDFIVVGNRAVSVLVTATTRVVISVDTVQFDDRDTGDDTTPFGGMFDLL